MKSELMSFWNASKSEEIPEDFDGTIVMVGGAIYTAAEKAAEILQINGSLNSCMCKVGLVSGNQYYIVTVKVGQELVYSAQKLIRLLITS